jgi:ribosomal protein L22
MPEAKKSNTEEVMQAERRNTMEARAYLKYARIAPRKVQIVLDLIRNQPARRQWRS